MVLKKFLPRDEQFFTLFTEVAENGVAGAQILNSIVTEGTDTTRIAELQKVEILGDELTHKIFHALNSTFVTPIDRDDIHALAVELDDFMDHLTDAGQRLGQYQLGNSTQVARELGSILVEQAKCFALIMPLLDEMNKHRDALRDAILDLTRLDNDADRLQSDAMLHLYDGVTEVPQLIVAMRWKEIYQSLLRATDQAERLANTLEGMLLKYA